MKSKVAVAMSGGVDSSLASILLQKQGYEVVGITMKLWNCEDFSGEKSEKTCCSPEHTLDAKLIAEAFNFPHYTLDLSDLFRKKVTDDFCTSYLQGRTPNPCIVCNTELKFGYLMQKIREMGIQYLATGHYAAIKKTVTGRYYLSKAKDTLKDQSYFLFELSQEQLKKLFFPLGDLKKELVRGLAREFNLRVAEKKESQDICFIPGKDYRKFIQKRTGFREKAGKIYDLNGGILGTHKGILNFTIGQRKGIGVSNETPLYVLETNREENSIIVGENKHLYRTRFAVRKLNFMQEEKPDMGKNYLVKIRYNGNPAEVKIESLTDDELVASFKEPQRAITPGQAAVFYDNDGNLVFGGWIEKSLD